MGRLNGWQVLIRVAAVVTAVALAGVLIKIIGSIFVGLLPPAFALTLSAGFAELGRQVGPALGPIAALAIIVAVAWVIIGRR